MTLFSVEEAYRYCSRVFQSLGQGSNLGIPESSGDSPVGTASGPRRTKSDKQELDFLNKCNTFKRRHLFGSKFNSRRILIFKPVVIFSHMLYF